MMMLELWDNDCAENIILIDLSLFLMEFIFPTFYLSLNLQSLCLTRYFMQFKHLHRRFVEPADLRPASWSLLNNQKFIWDLEEDHPRPQFKNAHFLTEFISSPSEQQRRGKQSLFIIRKLGKCIYKK